MSVSLLILLYLLAGVYTLILVGVLFWWTIATIQAAVARLFKRADWMPLWVTPSGKQYRDPL